MTEPSQALPDLTLDLCRLVGTLERQHDAGINPTFGQLSSLFGWSRAIQVALESGATFTARQAQACERCRRTTHDVVIAYGTRMCGECRQHVAAALALVQSLPPQVLVEQIRAPWPAGARHETRVTGSEPRD